MFSAFPSIIKQLSRMKVTGCDVKLRKTCFVILRISNWDLKCNFPCEYLPWHNRDAQEY